MAVSVSFSMLSITSMLWSKRLYFFCAVCLLVVFLLIALMTENHITSRTKFRLSVLRTTSAVFKTINSDSLKMVTSGLTRTTLNPTAKIEARTSKRKHKVAFKIKRRWKPFRKAISTTSSPTELPFNHNMNRSSCGIRLSKASMCPPLYTEIGGKCIYNNTRVICNDVRTLSDYRVRQAQLVITRLLNAFDVVARKHGIKYWLSSGTLLGAVRHKGFIPWDDDGDIEMTLDEYEKFYRNASRDLPDDIFFQNSESDPYLRPSNSEEYKSEKYKDIGLYKRTYNPRLRDRKSCYRYCIDYGCKWHDGAMVDIFVVESAPEKSYPLQQVEFEGLNFPVQNNWQEELTSKYGDQYMKIPKTISFAAYYPDAEHGCEQLQKQ